MKQLNEIAFKYIYDHQRSVFFTILLGLHN